MRIRTIAGLSGVVVGIGLAAAVGCGTAAATPDIICNPGGGCVSADPPQVVIPPATAPAIPLTKLFPWAKPPVTPAVKPPFDPQVTTGIHGEAPHNLNALPVGVTPLTGVGAGIVSGAIGQVAGASKLSEAAHQLKEIEKSAADHKVQITPDNAAMLKQQAAMIADIQEKLKQIASANNEMLRHITKA